MQENQSLNIIESLYNGVDPISGEEYPSSSPYQHPIVVRALGCARDALHARLSAAQKRARQPVSSGTRWTDEEEQQLLASFERGTPLNDIARSHTRSRYAIESRLVKLGKISETSFTPKLATGQGR